METLLKVVTFLILVDVNIGLDDSPCPRLFVYEHMQTGRWYGIITLLSTEDVNGIRLYMIFDAPSLQLGNWFGEVSSINNKDYVINNPNFTLKAYTPQTVRFYINYDVESPSPKLISFNLNNETICPESEKSTFNKPLPVSNEDEDYYPSDFAFISQKPQDDIDSECGIVINNRRPKREGYQYSLFNTYQNPELHNIIHQYLNVGYNNVLQPQPRPLITHGEPTLEGEYPWHAALYRAKDFDLAYSCGGALLSRFYVITVAHCVTKAKTRDVYNPNSIRVYLGKYYLKKFSNPGIQDLGVKEIKRHPEYNPYTYINDISLLRLAKPAEYTDIVRPVCLWPQVEDLDTVLEKQGKVVGWGYDQFGKITNELMEITMPVVSQETCVSSYPQFYSRYTSSKTYCAGFKNGSSVCNGDSGGGMVFFNKNSKRWYLRGLVSISIALRTHFCDYSNYVVFTDSAKYLHWIKSVIVK